MLPTSIWAVTLSIGLMIVVSRLTSAQVPKDVNRIMLRLHAPEESGLSQDYIKDEASAAAAH